MIMVKYRYIIRAIETEIKCQTTGANIRKRLRESMKRFHQNYADLSHEEAELYDKDGNILMHEIGEASSCHIHWDNLIGKDYNNLHLTHNHPNPLNDVPCCLSLNDMNILLLREYNGIMTTENIIGGLFGEPSDYIMRSVTACSSNGSSMTLIRTNDFPGKYFSHEDAFKVFQRFENVSLKYKNSYKHNYKVNMRKALKEYSKDEKKNMIMDSDFRKRISHQTLKEIGDINSFYEKEGVFSDLEKIGCKLEIKNGYVFDESWNDSHNWEIERFVNI